ncbi:YdiU family protein [Lutimaribacter sp. EGI FJ00015]|uniref:YdiU family protein n=1 Tax=Lutimaribacter degradans TaxID=2945989 RepID=A0ACC5ZWC5_9RHOB|nr:YdiU family protein [Lutimaribacter sp. EGI FJ00013]MCM2562468.1 YdiU family protein [Lutimaribacter sp. EGI FJ00013]MCO0613625.1 YdiU family protein [Lutimaribacter sp. EGI FJ00015]MCO0636597.1 YdiU family protein [Lutimaribacter sp. EGI FJ00014]
MTLHLPFDNSYATLPQRFFTLQAPEPVGTPRLIRFNHALADELGIDDGDPDMLARIFSGNETPEGAMPLAQAYAGHQFGGFSPQLGDGRAVLLGEVVDRAGHRRDIALKGSGRTPYSRMGDGRAWLGPVLREYVLSEAMHAMGIPTTRALAAVATGDPVYREQGALPGAVLTRVAASHIRVGTFEFFAARRDLEALEALFNYTRDRHYPDAADPAEMLDAVIDRQAALVADWLAAGFIHGVMNTDNTTLSGETIDYGPAAFMDAYHPVTVYSSIDRYGRYAYDQQGQIIAWNLAQLASALVPLMPDQDAAVTQFTQMIHSMPARVEGERRLRFRRKLGLASHEGGDTALIEDLLKLMQDHGADFTNTFRGLADGTARDQFADPSGFDAWATRWQDRIAREDDPQGLMRATNPAIIPRNHRVEQMIQSATRGDFAPFERLVEALSHPFDDHVDDADLKRPPEPHEEVKQTFCGT